MENEVKQRNQRNRRRERAQRMQAQRESKAKDGDSGEDESPAREKPPRPPARRKKSKEPLGEEDIIDGFSIMAFRTYEDLEAAVKCATAPRTTSLTSKPRLPLAALSTDPARHPPNNVNNNNNNNNNHGITLLLDAGTSDDSGRASERLTGSSVAPRDPDSSRDRLSDASSRCSSGKGYICDSEGDDDKASPDNSRNGSPLYNDVSMDDASDTGPLFRVQSAGAVPSPIKIDVGASPIAVKNELGAIPIGVKNELAAVPIAVKNELVARGGSGGALALSRAPVGGSASPAPAPLPQPAPSPAPAALPPPALPPPPFRVDRPPDGAHIPAATTKQQAGARVTADSPIPAPPAPSPLFPPYQAPAALPDYRQTEAERPERPEAAAPLDLHHRRQPPPPPESSRSYPNPPIGSSHIPAKHSSIPVYSNRPPHTFGVPNHISSHPVATTTGQATVVSRSISSQPSTVYSHTVSAVTTTAPPILTNSHTNTPVSTLPNFSHSHKQPVNPLTVPTSHIDPHIPPNPSIPPSLPPPEPRTEPLPAGYPPPSSYPPASYPPAPYPTLYAPYASSLQHTPYLPSSAASPRTIADTRTSLSASPLVAPKTPKGLRPHTPSSIVSAAPLHALHAYSPRGHSPTRERDSYSSNISSLSRASVNTPVSSAPPTNPPLSIPSIIPTSAPLPTSLPVPHSTPLISHSSSLIQPHSAPLMSHSSSLVTPHAGPLVSHSAMAAPLAGPLMTPLAAPTPTPAAPAANHLAHSLAPVPTVGSISSGAKPPAHWGVTRPTATERGPTFGSSSLFGAPLPPPPNPNPFSAESLFQTSPGADLLRRELDNRFLAAAGGAFSIRTEMHHHQHQHTHVHQHPHHQLYQHHSPFKDVSKMPPLYRGGLALGSMGYPYSSGLLHAPYVPPAPALTTYKPVVSTAGDVAKPPRPALVKSGKWNAMHVRIAWEIYNHQQKEKGTSGAVGAIDKDKLRGFPTPHYRSPYELPPAPYLPSHHALAAAGVSPFARYGAGGFPAAPGFGLSYRDYPLPPAPPLHPHPAALLHDPWRPSPRAPPPHDERERERARRDKEERDRRKQREIERVRQRSPLRNGEIKDERKEQVQHPPQPQPVPQRAPLPPPYAWDPYRWDPLQHMRFPPLVEAAIRAEEESRAKMFSAYAAQHQQYKGPMLHRPLPPLAPPPLEVLKKEEPR